MKKIFTIALILISFGLNAQISTFLEKGNSGGGLTAGYEKSLGYDGIYGEMTYSHKGVIDIDFCIYQGRFNENEEGLINLDAQETYYSGSLSWWFLREKLASDIDVNVALTAGYEAGNYSDYITDTISYSEYNGYTGGWVGANFNVGFNLQKNWSVQAFYITNFGFGYDQYIEAESAETASYSGIASYLGTSLIKKFNNGSSIVATFKQGIATYNNSSIFETNIAYIFPLN